jgi:hypothetical protein
MLVFNDPEVQNKSYPIQSILQLKLGTAIAMNYYYSTVIQMVIGGEPYIYRTFQVELYNGVPKVAVWRVLRKPLNLKAYKLSISQDVEQWIICTPFSVKVFVPLARQ